MKKYLVVLSVVLFTITASAIGLSVLGQTVKVPCIVKRVPLWMDCPAPPTVGCSSGGLRYKTEKQWAIRANSSPASDIIPSSEGTPGSFQIDVIVPTGYSCGGRWITPFFGNFDAQRVENPAAYVRQGANQPCYHEYDCDWEDAG